MQTNDESEELNKPFVKEEAAETTTVRMEEDLKEEETTEPTLRGFTFAIKPENKSLDMKEKEEEEEEKEEEKEEEELLNNTSSSNNNNNNNNSKTLNESSLDLNMSSISARAENSSPTATKQFVINDYCDEPQTTTTAAMLVRSNSELSLYSQISSVSEHYEKMKREKKQQQHAENSRPNGENDDDDNDDDEKLVEKEEKEEEEPSKAAAKRAALSSIKRRAPVTRKTVGPRPAKISAFGTHMDDNELSGITKANEESASSNNAVAAVSSGGVAGARCVVGAALRRRRSDLSSMSSSSAGTTSVASSMTHKAAIAKVKANMERLPPTLGI